MAKRSKSKSKSRSSNRILNAFELAQREVGGSDGDTDGRIQSHSGSKRKGAVVNLLKKVEKGYNGDDGYGSDYGDGNDDDDDFEDEILDSDEALGSDDEYDVMDSKMSQTRRDKQAQGIELDDEEEGGYTSIDEDELMPLSQIWDINTKTSDSEAESSNENDLKLKNDISDEEVSSSNEDEESSSESESESNEENSDENPFDELSEDGEEVELNTITSNLLKETAKAQSKRLENYGAGEENEFSLPTVSLNGNGFSNGKLSLEDMMNVVDDQTVTAQATLIKGESFTAAVPLPQRIQQRHERKAAYEISKKEVNKWKDVVQQNRRADHLYFGNKREFSESTAFTLNQSGAVQSELQSKVAEVLKESNLVDPQKESTFEELATAKMSPEEMKKRTTEMRLMRELMFREERKAKRIKKIKSKSYRRIKKKEMLRNREAASLSDEDNEEREIARAQERMTLKHRANSKWARDMVKHGMTNDVQTREEMEEMLRQGERLKAKIIDRNSDEEDENANMSDLERDTYQEDAQLRDSVGKTGVLNMKFMKNAEAREREANKEALRKLRAVQSGEDMELFDDGNEESGKSGEYVMLNKGRRVYVPGSKEIKQETEAIYENALKEQKIDESRSLVNRLKKINNINGDEIEIREEKDNDDEVKKKSQTQAQKKSASANPWLDESDEEDSTMVKKSTKINIVDKDSSKLVKSSQKISKEMEKQVRKQNAKGKKNNDDELLLDTSDSNTLNIVDPYGGSDDESNKQFMFKQQEIISEAFAGDDVVVDFSEEKKRVAEDEDDKEEDVTLPGWGQWAGAGENPKKKKRKFIKKIKGVVEKEKRKDRHLQNVIINEKMNKKNLKYHASSVPFPYENKEQYERSLRMPLGPEWTSQKTHSRFIKPRILTKPGQVIDPLKQPFQ
ncbi:hypothetical protein RI543_000562 [Arxiozyma heterogenica]|uniref:U3 small nucleolar RNA-associated protein 14 n=1 Tax=Arxiozyma heterogenica TaxID=278026 RepID=A0AAN7W5V5_9SACH|nr:hypothetical protein RI543_000562 [Kazachstania heterogenica]